MENFWMQNGKRTKKGNLVVAPEDFVLRHEIIVTGVGKKADPDEVTILHKGKAFFTYDEAMALYEQGHFPEGWRLPTFEEAVALLEEFTEATDTTSLGFVKKLNLKFNGYVYPKMRNYNEDPTPASEAIEGRYLEGRFWVYNPDGDSLYAIHVKRHDPPVLQTFCDDSGANVRLVHI